MVHAWQALVNVAVVLRMMPVLGVPLPLLSYGGSALMTNLIGLGAFGLRPAGAGIPRRASASSSGQGAGDDCPGAWMRLKVVMAGGGTAGHTSPLIATAQQLAELAEAEITCVGTPEINAALFVATAAAGCPLDQVQSRYCQIGFEVMGLLYERQKNGGSSTVEADRQAWRRLAA